jgi:hypothetical protein
MRLNDFDEQVLQAAQAEHDEATLAELAHALDAEARAVEGAVWAGNAVEAAEAATHLMLAGALLLHGLGLSWTAALLDAVGSQSYAAVPQPSPAPPRPKRRRRKAS